MLDYSCHREFSKISQRSLSNPSTNTDAEIRTHDLLVSFTSLCFFIHSCVQRVVVGGPHYSAGVDRRTKRSFVRQICVSATRFTFSVHSVLQDANKPQTALMYRPTV